MVGQHAVSELQPPGETGRPRRSGTHCNALYGWPATPYTAMAATHLRRTVPRWVGDADPFFLRAFCMCLRGGSHQSAFPTSPPALLAEPAHLYRAAKRKLPEVLVVLFPRGVQPHLLRVRAHERSRQAQHAQHSSGTRHLVVQKG